MAEIVDEATVRAALSPSRAGDFLACPLLFRFRVVDRLPEPRDPAMVRGTLVHAVLEVLFDERAADRTLARSIELLPGQWDVLRDADESLATMFDSDADEQTWLESAHELLANYFRLEDPARIEPAAREQRVEYPLDDVMLGGIADRIDVAPDGRIRVVDFKTGGSPSERFEAKALFQMKFYALAIWRSKGRMPSLLQLLYLKNAEVLSYEPTEDDLLATERKLRALWHAIRRAYETGEFVARPSALCRFCAHQSLCPEFGGTPPDMPTIRIEPVLPSAT